ncbi:Dyp-type peroxidase [Streptomyces sp. V3I7]|uniref:Dyp-type peroxidase n=1 Tax=Streptomyces sp. V3I7 TaxID=3042278 RepID=UPI002787B41C|nr:Dyp-type peroxidase [Streptomyces sp. V3I7]MDQ0988941.1 putative iron-dependent peroxidase [Streptomyces sp. V3I7]
MIQSQSVIVTPARDAIFLVYTIANGGESTVRDLLHDVPSLLHSVGFRIPEAELTCVVGIGSQAWDRLYDGPRPRDLHPFEPLAGEGHQAPSTPGDILFHIRALHRDICFELAAQIARRMQGAATAVDEVHGFKFFDDRDLLGFVDGSANPTGKEAVASVYVGDEDPGFKGGSYVIVQKYLHDLAKWNAMTVEDQEMAIGRTKLPNIELPDDVKPPNSHVALNTIYDADGQQLQIVRENKPFGRVGDAEFGTYFIGYARTPAVTEHMLRNMFLGTKPGMHDRILDFSTAVTGCLFYVPTVEFLKNQPAMPGSTS